ncbi:IclR family transcriptional regulator [Nocardia cyriacigeorgica]|uniref:Helix-turn-helix domain-containing protein n=1 Tax=Nocardia cyriacigeorgica TaxID=135487 RepID=A0A6P1D9R7_9NOCA|nr:helix-turn-helix domain-containing protein [Nocardia cyriacigeorgica]NEW46291.1 helix-turn-helix domain-containing protein [Nocardia cyriacigeorgica]
MPVSDTPNTAVPSSTLDRLSLVIDSFRDTPRATLTDIVRHTGIPRTSTLRMLDQLVRMGWLRRRGHQYELGDRLAELGILAAYQNGFDRMVGPLLSELHRVTGHIVHLGVLDGGEVVYLDKVGGRTAPTLHTQVGSRIPAAASTIGKALTAPAHRAAADRPAGIAFGVCTSGLGCIGARIGTYRGTQIGLSISGPRTQVRFDLPNAAPVRLTAAAIAHYLDLSSDPLPAPASAHRNPRLRAPHQR